RGRGGGGRQHRAGPPGGGGRSAGGVAVLAGGAGRAGAARGSAPATARGPDGRMCRVAGAGLPGRGAAGHGGGPGGRGRGRGRTAGAAPAAAGGVRPEGCPGRSGGGGVRVLLWHVHGSWTTAFVQGRHEYLIPVTPDRGADGLGRAQTWSWPASAMEITKEEAAEAEVDVVILQRPQELGGLGQEWLGGRRPGREVPAVYLEHNAPQGRVNELRHVAADRDDL